MPRLPATTPMHLLADPKKPERKTPMKHEQIELEQPITFTEKSSRIQTKTMPNNQSITAQFMTAALKCQRRLNSDPFFLEIVGVNLTHPGP